MHASDGDQTRGMARRREGRSGERVAIDSLTPGCKGGGQECVPAFHCPSRDGLDGAGEFPCSGDGPCAVPLPVPTRAHFFGTREHRDLGSQHPAAPGLLVCLRRKSGCFQLRRLTLKIGLQTLKEAFAAKIPVWQDEIKSIKKQYGDKVLGTCTVEQVRSACHSACSACHFASAPCLLRVTHAQCYEQCL